MNTALWLAPPNQRVCVCVFVRDLSLGVLADFAWHVVRTPDERACDVVVVDGDDSHWNQKVDQEDHHRVDLRVHLIGQWVRHAVDESHVGVLPLALNGEEEGQKETRR